MSYQLLTALRGKNHTAAMHKGSKDNNNKKRTTKVMRGNTDKKKKWCRQQKGRKEQAQRGAGERSRWMNRSR